MSQITTHILDTAKGRPASGIAVALWQKAVDNWQQIADGRTDNDGRIADWLDDRVLPAGVYKLEFATRPYFNADGVASFYPQIEILFEIEGNGQHYHVPLLLNPFGYTTYRGS